MARRKKEEQNPEIKNLAEQAEAAASEKAAAPAEKPKRGRRKKADVESTPEPVSEKKAVRRPRKKAVVPNFVIQNAADQGITYEEIVEKVKAATAAEEVKSVDIYVKAEEGKAYYVINGEMTGAVDLF